jgi:ubiquinone/menaquinone biosynthesis C-methylase UbiE
MIIYKSGESRSANYDRAYTESSQHFTHKATFKALDALIAGDGIPRSCLDVGCGQGQVVAHIAGIAKKHRADFDGHKFVGLDLSGVAIEQSNAAHPELGWILDRYEDFAVSDWLARCFPDGIDLIVNKSGFTMVKSEAKYIETLQRTNTMLADGGHYLLIMNKSFYEKWNGKRGWSRGAMEMTGDIFGEKTVFPSSSYYFYLYAKRV